MFKWMDRSIVQFPYLFFGISRTLCEKSSLITSYSNGYDGSMMNGLQSLSQWREAFNNPSNGRLGLLNAIQVSIVCTYTSDKINFNLRTLVLLLHIPSHLIFLTVLVEDRQYSSVP